MRAAFALLLIALAACARGTTAEKGTTAPRATPTDMLDAMDAAGALCAAHGGGYAGWIVTDDRTGAVDSVQCQHSPSPERPKPTPNRTPPDILRAPLSIYSLCHYWRAEWTPAQNGGCIIGPVPKATHGGE